MKGQREEAKDRGEQKRTKKNKNSIPIRELITNKKKKGQE